MCAIYGSHFAVWSNLGTTALRGQAICVHLNWEGPDWGRYKILEGGDSFTLQKLFMKADELSVSLHLSWTVLSALYSAASGLVWGIHCSGWKCDNPTDEERSYTFKKTRNWLCFVYDWSKGFLYLGDSGGSFYLNWMMCFLIVSKPQRGKLPIVLSMMLLISAVV